MPLDVANPELVGSFNQWYRSIVMRRFSESVGFWISDADPDHFADRHPDRYPNYLVAHCSPHADPDRGTECRVRSAHVLQPHSQVGWMAPPRSPFQWETALEGTPHAPKLKQWNIC